MTFEFDDYKNSFDYWYMIKAQNFENTIAKQMGPLEYLEEFSKALAYMCQDQSVSDKYDFFEDNNFTYKDAMCYLLYKEQNWSKRAELRSELLEIFNKYLGDLEFDAYDP